MVIEGSDGGAYCLYTVYIFPGGRKKTRKRKYRNKELQKEGKSEDERDSERTRGKTEERNERGRAKREISEVGTSEWGY